MKTVLCLMAQYDGAVMVPADTVRRDYFPSMSLPVFLRRLADSSIPLPVVQMGTGQKSAKMIALQDLANYIDRQRSEAIADLRKARI